jgi:hypothetical protein
VQKKGITMAKITSNVTNYFTIDFINKTICGSPASFKKASTGVGAIYEELISKINAHPKFELTQIGNNPDKKTYKGLTYDFMKAYIKIQDDAENLLKKMDLVEKNASKFKDSTYPIVKKWFLDNFGTEMENSKKKHFDMDKAISQINENLNNSILN